MSKNEYICDCDVINRNDVNEVISKMPNNDIMNKLGAFYKLLGDDTRCKILYTLDNKEMCVCDIANVLSMSKSSVSHQLSTLKESGVVKPRKDGKIVYYSLDDDHIAQIVKKGREHVEEL